MIHPQFQNDVILSLLPFWGSVFRIFVLIEAFFFFFLSHEAQSSFFITTPWHTSNTLLHTYIIAIIIIIISFSPDILVGTTTSTTTQPTPSFLLFFLSLSLFCLNFWNQEKREGWHRCPNPTSWGWKVGLAACFHGYFSVCFYLPELLPLFGLLVSWMFCQYHHG